MPTTKPKPPDTPMLDYGLAEGFSADPPAPAPVVDAKREWMLIG